MECAECNGLRKAKSKAGCRICPPKSFRPRSLGLPRFSPTPAACLRASRELLRCAHAHPDTKVRTYTKPCTTSTSPRALLRILGLLAHQYQFLVHDYTFSLSLINLHSGSPTGHTRYVV
ncbi:hypothetical protein VTO73DRAFT_12978 [Trametes versicolor]